MDQEKYLMNIKKPLRKEDLKYSKKMVSEVDQ
jgi:hypothetical protein